MKLLDFSSAIFDSLSKEILWEKNILEFIQNWQNENDFILSQTSGSTGIPKTLKLPKSAMKMSAKMTGEFFRLQPGNTALLCMPVNFIAGKMMIVRAIELKLKLYCVEPKSQLKLNFTDSIDFVPMTPMQVENSFGELAKIKTLLIGGAPLSDSLRTKLLEIPTRSFESYGMTETITHIGLKEISEEFFRTLNGISIRQDNRDCLVIQTPYFEEEIITNDIVELRNQSEFKWLGRFDNVINSGGIKLFPEQIEKKINPHISEEFIITSIPDKVLGEKLILIVESKRIPNFQLPTSNLGKYEIPKEIHFMEKFPRTESGKIQREKLKENIIAL
ncbi:MAG TPA: AMP-binding protein [Moheibacter sp.]|nr:AMP-binding protein [Moheibacter sp.]